VKKIRSFGVGILMDLEQTISAGVSLLWISKPGVHVQPVGAPWTLPSAARSTPKTDQMEQLEAQHESYGPAAVYLRDSSDKSDGESGHRPPGYELLGAL
jgi:hypothetical protein